MSNPIPNTTIEDAIADWVTGATGLPVLWEMQDAPRPAAPYVAMLLHVEPVGQDWRQNVENPLTFTDKEIEDVDTTADTVTITGHALATGAGPLRLETTGTLPDGLEEDHDYWWIRVDDETGQFAESLYKANAGDQVDLIDAGSGDHVVVSTADTRTAGAELLFRVRGTRRCRLILSCFAAAATGPTAAQAALNEAATKARLPSHAAALRAAGLGPPICGPAVIAGGIIQSAHFEPRAVMECVFFATVEFSETGTYVEFLGIGEQIGDTAEVALFVPRDPSA